MVLQKDNYYVVEQLSDDKRLKEEILVFYAGIEIRLHDSIQIEEKHHFEVIAMLTECSEGSPEIGEHVHCTDKDLEEMSKYNVSFREPTPTELVLYAKAR